MPNIRTASFEIAAQQAEEKDEENLLDISLFDKNGESLGKSVMIRQPTAGEFGRLSVAFGRNSNYVDMVAPFDHFLGRIIVEPMTVRTYEGFEKRTDFVDIDWLWDLVEDRETDFDLADLMQLCRKFMEEFTGFPTKSSSDSSASRSSRGKSSTAGSRRAGSTRSTSPSAASQG